MKALLCNKKGTIYVSVIFISLIIFIVLGSLFNILVNNIRIINSNNDNYRAGYIAESILELKIANIMELSHEVINKYLLDLQTYKIEYIEKTKEIPHIPYNPPNFANYIRLGIILDIKTLSETTDNPFEEYKDNHYYKIDIKSDSNEEFINITATGRYNKARKFINVKLELPKIIENGFDEHSLPRIAIYPMNIVEYYQTVGE